VNRTVAVTTVLATLLGIFFGYNSAGVGGAILHGVLIGVGGILLGLLVTRTAVLLRRWWWVVLTATAVIIAATLTWNVHL
jgi:hypothetical protein